MNLAKLTISLIVAGAMLAIYGFATKPAADVVATTETQRLASFDSINGLAPIEDVVALFEQRSEERPLDYINRTQLGLALNAQAREQADLEGYEAAESVLIEALTLNPKWKTAQLALANSLHSQHRFTEAQDVAAKILAEDDTVLSALALRGDTFLELGDYGSAESDYRSLVDAERSGPTVSRLARLASLSGEHHEAIVLATEALNLSDTVALRPASKAFYWFQLGRMQFEAGKVDHAIESYRQALAVDPGNPAAAESLAFTYTAVGEQESAAELYAVLVADGGAPDLHGLYARVLRSLGQRELADRHDELGRALAAETLDRFPAERRHLVGFFLDRDTEVAVALAEADFAERRDVGAYDTLAWALYRDGQFERAAVVVEEAGPGDPPFAAMLYHRAAIAAAVGDQGAAQRLARAAVSLNPFFHPTEADAAKRLSAGAP